MAGQESMGEEMRREEGKAHRAGEARRDDAGRREEYEAGRGGKGEGEAGKVRAWTRLWSVGGQRGRGGAGKQTKRE